MHWLDWIVMGVFTLALIGIIVWVTRQKEESSDDYFLAGRGAGWVAIGASIFASNIGSEHLIGLAGAGASSGMAMAHWEIQGWMILILGWAFVPFYSRSMVLTMPEFLEKRYNSAIAHDSVADFINQLRAHEGSGDGICRRSGIPTGVRHRHIVGHRLLLDFRHRPCAHYRRIYTVLGGMKSVLYTSVLQTPILLLGSLIIVVLGLKESLGGWNEMMERRPQR